MTNWLSLSKFEQVDLFNQISVQTGLPAYAIEKDAWVTLILRILFTSEISEHIIFKGGTSLSKAYGLIERFSEDIDLSIDRVYLGFKGDLSKGQIRKLRRKSHEFSLNQLPMILQSALSNYGISQTHYEIIVPNIKISDKDPEIVHINYKSVFETQSYLQSKVLLELGARSLIEPFENKTIQSIIDITYPDKFFSEEEFIAKTVVFNKTFLEKLILLHEEFQKPIERIRYNRMSRHLYDIVQIINNKDSNILLNNQELFNNICLHREKFTPIKNINYQTLSLSDLNFLPPTDFMDLYRKDYKEMQTNMIYGSSPKFSELIAQLNLFKNKLATSR